MCYTRPRHLGFTLIELMVAVLIIGIFSALAIPGILEIRYRNTLTDSVERVRSVAQATRDLAMLTKNATVMEISATTMWINVLDGPSCEALTIGRRCTGSVADATGTVSLYETGPSGIGETAGVRLCGGVALGPDASGDCKISSTLDISDGFAICYSGKGELWYRIGADENTTCTAEEGALDEGTTWTRACSAPPTIDLGAITLPDGAAVTLTEGAVLMLNRYDGTSCDKDIALDVMRLVKLPTNGAPFSELPI